MTAPAPKSLAYLQHIRDAISRIRDYTQGGRDEFFSTPMVQDAVIRQLEIVGEATKQLDASIRENTPAIPWKQIAGMRDVLIHQYFGVDLMAVWEVVDQHLDPLSEAVQTLLEDLT